MRLVMVVMAMFLAVGVFAQTEVTLNAGNGLDGGALFISSFSIRAYNSTSGTTSAWSTTRSAFDLDEPYDNSKNTQWLVKNRKEYDVMIDSCIWNNKGTEALLGNDMPFLLEKGDWVSLDAKCGEKVHMRIMSTLKGWTTTFYLRTYKK